MNESDLKFDGEPFIHVNISDVNLAILEEIITDIRKIHGIDICTLDQRNLHKLITKILNNKKKTSIRNRVLWWTSVQVTQYTVKSVVPVLYYISKSPRNWL
jgi:hypothetical protein